MTIEETILNLQRAGYTPEQLEKIASQVANLPENVCDAECEKIVSQLANLPENVRDAECERIAEQIRNAAQID